MRYAVIDTPMGPLTVGSTDKGLAAIQFGRKIPPNGMIDKQANCVVIEQLHEYFQGRRSSFELPIDFRGTPFQIAVWKELLTIPYGETRSYGDIATRLGKPGAARAIGMANNKNPIAIVVPCHRVIGRDGSLTGYAGGLPIKSRLLTLESSQYRMDLQDKESIEIQSGRNSAFWNEPGLKPSTTGSLNVSPSRNPPAGK